MSMSWFKHYNEASEGQLIGNLIAEKNYEAVVLWWVILENVSRFESENERGVAQVSIDRLAKQMNMKPTKIERLLGHIAFVSQSDLICETGEKQGRYVTFRLRKWLELQETRGGKRSAKLQQKPGRSKKEEVRSKNTVHLDERELERIYSEYPRKEGKSGGMKIVKREIKSPEDSEQLIKAIKNYRTNCEREKKEKKYIKLFSTFMGEWRDWLDEDNGTASFFTTEQLDHNRRAREEAERLATEHIDGIT